MTDERFVARTPAHERTKKHRAGYVPTMHRLDKDGESRSFYTGGTWPEWMGLVRKWCVDNGYSETHTGILNEQGHIGSTTDWGLFDERNDSFKAFRYNQATVSMLDAERADWPASAKDLCERYERKIYELFRALDEAYEAVDFATLVSERSVLEVARANGQARKAEATADELRQRAKEFDPARLRREIEAEFTKKTEAIAEENRRLAASLHEATSQATKLAEDKKRLRSALNTARSR